MDAREQLAAATPRPWRVMVSGTGRVAGIDGPDDEVIIVQDEPAHAYPEMQSGALILSHEDASLIADAVNEREPLLDLEAWIRHRGENAHPVTCALWVELDDVAAYLHPVGTCDCGLADTLARLEATRGPSPDAAPVT